MVALVNERPELRNEVYAPGFIQKVEEFTKDIKAAGNSQTTIEKLCKDFCSEVGPCFISKSVMGCVLDYYISVDKSLLKDGMTAGGALEFKRGLHPGDGRRIGERASAVVATERGAFHSCHDRHEIGAHLPAHQRPDRPRCTESLCGQRRKFG